MTLPSIGHVIDSRSLQKKVHKLKCDNDITTVTNVSIKYHLYTHTGEKIKLDQDSIILVKTGRVIEIRLATRDRDQTYSLSGVKLGCSMSHLERLGLFTSSNWVSIRRGTKINLSYVSRIEGKVLILKKDIEVIVPRSIIEEVRKKVRDWKVNKR